MTALLASSTFAFADGNAGHACSLGTAPNAGEVDVLCVNSNTVVSTPSGFTAAPSAVNSQGAYIFRRTAAGGESSTVTITTAGDHNTQVSWSRWSGLLAADDAASTRVDGASGNTTPPHSTNALAATGELVIAFAALHSIGVNANQNTPVWSSGYAALTSVIQGSGASGVLGYVGYNANAGTAVESPSVSWSGDGAFNRYMLTLTFTAAPTEPVDTAVGAGAPIVARTTITTVTAQTTRRIFTSRTRGSVL